MSTFNAQQLAAALPALAALSDADAAAQPGWSAPIVSPVVYFVGHRKMLDVCCLIDPAHGIAAAEWVAGQLKTRLPTTYGVYVTGTEPDGSTGGLDVSNPATVAFIGFLVSAAPNDTPPAPFTSAMGNAVIALGTSTSYVFGGVVLASDVAAARAALALQTGADTLYRWVSDKDQQARQTIANGQAAGVLPTTDALKSIYAGG
jgi:hypothetical protein